MKKLSDKKICDQIFGKTKKMWEKKHCVEILLQQQKNYENNYWMKKFIKQIVIWKRCEDKNCNEQTLWWQN